MGLVISKELVIPEDEIEVIAVRAQGPGGQNVNKVSSAVHLRFDIPNSSLPDRYKERLLAMGDARITKDGVVIIKAQRSRSQEANREEARNRLTALIHSVMVTPRRRKPTKPSRGSQARRLKKKAKRSEIKDLRRKPTE